MVKNDLNDISTRYVYNENKQLSKVIKSERFLLESKEFYREELFYDKANNRTKRVVNGVEELYAYDNRNRLTQFTKDNKTTSFKWDNAGNLLQDDKANYTYNDFNQTTKVETFDGNIQINKYDAEGLRYEMEENGQLVQFIFNTNKEVIAEKENEWTIYIRGSEILASSNDHARTYYHYANDEMGSCTHIVDDSKVLNEYEYDAWGNVVNKKETVKNRFKFNGQQLDPITHQYYLRARFYNPVVARFTQEDTYRGDGLNLYAYCANNPVYYIDPSGNAKLQVCPDMTSIIEEGRNLPEARILPNRTISNDYYSELRKKTPNRSLKKIVNEEYENLIKGRLDLALRLAITKKLEPDHIVSMNIITRMEGFNRLTKEQQLQVLNNEKNFIGLTRSANASKQDKSFREWERHEGLNIQVNPEFKNKMIEVEEMLERILQKQIDDFNLINMS